jgi:hypothetical protein
MNHPPPSLPEAEFPKKQIPGSGPWISEDFSTLGQDPAVICQKTIFVFAVSKRRWSNFLDSKQFTFSIS